MRPCDPTDDILSDEDFSDEELELTEMDLERALKSKVGGREPKANGKTKTSSSGKTSHEENSRTGMAMAQQIWNVVKNVDAAEDCNVPVDAAILKSSLRSARASQRQEKAGSTVSLAEDAAPAVQMYAKVTIQSVKHWLTDVKKTHKCRQQETFEYRTVCNGEACCGSSHGRDASCVKTEFQ